MLIDFNNIAPMTIPGMNAGTGTMTAQILTKEEFADVTGKYFDRSTRMASSSELSFDEGNAKELWGWSEKAVGL